jgi:hypothetical protein
MCSLPVIIVDCTVWYITWDSYITELILSSALANSQQTWLVPKGLHGFQGVYSFTSGFQSQSAVQRWDWLPSFSDLADTCCQRLIEHCPYVCVSQHVVAQSECTNFADLKTSRFERHTNCIFCLQPCDMQLLVPPRGYNSGLEETLFLKEWTTLESRDGFGSSRASTKSHELIDNGYIS